MALRFPDRLESNNPAAYGVVKANQVSGHKTVNTVENLYALADAILSDSGTNANNDAIGQRWYIVSENRYYELVNWTNRKTSAGWVKIYTDSDIQTKLDTKADKVPGKSLVEDTEINKLKELSNKSILDSQIADAKLAGTSAQTNLTSHIEDINNPHKVTKNDVGLSNVDNTSDTNKPVSTALRLALDSKVDKVPGKSLVSDAEITKLSGLKPQTEIDSSIADAKKAGTDAQNNLNTHSSNTGNPHNVTKALVGLDRVNNTSDAEKPISTATQSALDIKANKSDLNNKISSTAITNIVSLTEDEYTSLPSKDSKTLYLIVNAVLSLEDGTLILLE